MCSATRDATGDYICLRCGYYWSKNDTPATCKTSKQIGRDALKQIIKDLKK